MSDPYYSTGPETPEPPKKKRKPKTPAPPVETVTMPPQVAKQVARLIAEYGPGTRVKWLGGTRYEVIKPTPEEAKLAEIRRRERKRGE